jgi:hypothetical protein
MNTTLYEITVDYSRRLDEMILAGRYDFVSNDIMCGRFCLAGRGKQTSEAHLVHFDRGTIEKDMQVCLRRLGLRHGAIEEVLAFGELYPDVQREFPTIGLASIFKTHGLFCAPCIQGSLKSRELRLAIPWLCNTAMLCGRYRILAIRHH